MVKLLESIRLENGNFENLQFHQQRLNRARKKLFGCRISFDLLEVLQAFVNDIPPTGLFKCRIIYSEQIENVEIIPHITPKINSLKIVHDEQIEYSHKYLDRNQIEKLYNLKEECDDILIVKDGLITDSSYANILFFNGKDWVTPEKPLLKGTQRAALLEEEIIQTADIHVEDLQYFEKARLVNAMIRFKDEFDLDIDQIYI